MNGYAVKQNQTAMPLEFLMVDSSDHITPKTGLSPTVTINKNGSSFASPAGAVTEVGNGWYKVAGNATDANTLGPLTVHATATGADPSDTKFMVVAYDPLDAAGLGLSRLDAAISTRSTYAGADTSGTTTLLSRIPNTLSLSNINAEVDTALADYDAPTKTEMDAAFTQIKGAGWSGSTDTLEKIKESVWTRSLSSLTETGTVGKALADALNGVLAWLTSMIEDSSGRRFTAKALEESPADGGGGGGGDYPTAEEIAEEIADLLPGVIPDPLASNVPGDYEEGTAGYVLGNLPSGGGEGPGSTQVDHNFGGADALAYSYSGTPIDNAEILIYLTSDYDAGQTARNKVIAASRTDVHGRWTRPVMLDPGEYTVQFFKQGVYGPDAVDITVE